MINSYNQSPPADPSRLRTPSSIMKISLWIFTLSVFAQIVGTCIFGVYFYKKVDKIEEEINLNDDYIFLRKIQKCMKRENVDSSLLSCEAILAKLHHLISEITQPAPPEAGHEKLTDNKQIPSPWPYIGGNDIVLKKGEVVAIHLVGDRPNSTKDALRWQEKGYLTTKSQISHTNGKLRVESPGVYYVYSQVTFSASTQFPKAPFVQYLYMQRPHETERLLLKGANTLVSQPSGLHSSQLGAVFTFKKNDFIFVNVTDPSCIDYSPEYTYFGMFKLAETS